MVQQPLVGQGHYEGFTITLIHTTLGRTPLDEWSARHRDLYLTIQDIYMRLTSKAPAGIRTRNPRKRAAADPRHAPVAFPSGRDLVSTERWVGPKDRVWTEQRNSSWYCREANTDPQIRSPVTSLPLFSTIIIIIITITIIIIT